MLKEITNDLNQLVDLACAFELTGNSTVAASLMDIMHRIRMAATEADNAAHAAFMATVKEQEASALRLTKGMIAMAEVHNG